MCLNYIAYFSSSCQKLRNNGVKSSDACMFFLYVYTYTFSMLNVQLCMYYHIMNIKAFVLIVILFVVMCKSVGYLTFSFWWKSV